MIDFHSHFLPAMDDGANDISESVQILKESFRQGITDIAATPHFYAEENSPEEFLRRRDASYKSLLPSLEQDMPEIHLGAEVKYFEGISRNEDIGLLKLDGTDILLVEMPFMPWVPRMINDVCELSMLPKTKVMLAHIERYFQFGAQKYLTFFEEYGILIQVNADSFVKSKEKRKLLKLLKNKKIHVLGSDCHNMDTRPQMMSQAYEAIRKRLGDKPIWDIDYISNGLIRPA